MKKIIYFILKKKFILLELKNILFNNINNDDDIRKSYSENNKNSIESYLILKRLNFK